MVCDSSSWMCGRIPTSERLTSDKLQIYTSTCDFVLCSSGLNIVKEGRTSKKRRQGGGGCGCFVPCPHLSSVWNSPLRITWFLEPRPIDLGYQIPWDWLLSLSRVQLTQGNCCLLVLLQQKEEWERVLLLSLTHTHTQRVQKTVWQPMVSVFSATSSYIRCQKRR